MSHSQHGVPIGDKARNYHPKTYPIKTRVNSVPCPTCGAEVEEPCVSVGMREVPAGQVVKTYHKTRQRMACRADNIARGIGA